MFRSIFFVGLLIVIMISGSQCRAQDLEPGFLSEMPIGGNIAIGAFGISRGEILLDNTLPIEDLDANMNVITAGYFRSFKLFNRLTKFDIIVPYAFGDYQGLVEGSQRSASRNGFGDPLLRISMILIGSDPMKPKEFFKREEKKFKMGVSLRVLVPVGQYDSENLINLGTNRWGFKTAIAGSYTIRKKLILETHLTTWFFGRNDNYFGGNQTKQDPLFGLQVHATYLFKPGVWLAGSLGGVRGGTSYVNGEERARQKNNRYGIAFAYRLGRKHSLKAAYTNALLTATGADFNTMLLAYQFLWFDRKDE